MSLDDVGDTLGAARSDKFDPARPSLRLPCAQISVPARWRGSQWAQPIAQQTEQQLWSSFGARHGSLHSGHGVRVLGGHS